MGNNNCCRPNSEGIEDEIYEAKKEKNLHTEPKENEVYGRASSFRKGPLFQVEFEEEN